MRYETATHIGKRKNNQDYAQVFTNEKGYLAAFLCDGLGGHQGGDVASTMVVSQLGNCWKKSDFEIAKSDDFRQWIQDMVDHENQRLLKAADQYKDLRGMGTTLVVAFFMEDMVLIVNLGDSRAYSFDGNDLNQITQDHTLLEELKKSGEILSGESNHLVNKHMLTRSLGIDEEIKLDFYLLEYESFKSVMLCSDGLSNFVSTDEMITIIESSATVKEKTEQLIQSALNNEATDNITVTIIEKEGSTDD